MVFSGTQVRGARPTGDEAGKEARMERHAQDPGPFPSQCQAVAVLSRECYCPAYVQGVLSPGAELEASLSSVSMGWALSDGGEG